MKLIWNKHACGGLIANIPGGGSARIQPKAFGSNKTRLRLFGHTLQPYFFHHQFYKSVTEARRVLEAKLREIS